MFNKKKKNNKRSRSVPPNLCSHSLNLSLFLFQIPRFSTSISHKLRRLSSLLTDSPPSSLFTLFRFFLLTKLPSSVPPTWLPSQFLPSSSLSEYLFRFSLRHSDHFLGFSFHVMGNWRERPRRNFRNQKPPWSAIRNYDHDPSLGDFLPLLFLELGCSRDSWNFFVLH